MVTVLKRIRAPKLKHIRAAIDDYCPVLVSMDKDHWAVVFGYGRSTIYIADPSLRRSLLCRCPIETFRRRWGQLGRGGPQIVPWAPKQQFTCAG